MSSMCETGYHEKCRGGSCDCGCHDTTDDKKASIIWGLLARLLERDREIARLKAKYEGDGK